MSERRDSALLQDIVEAGTRRLSYTETISYEMFLEDTKTQDAVIRNIEILGEATKQLSDAFVMTHNDIPWSRIAKMRDKLIHHYFGVNLDIVWNVVKTDIPILLKEVGEMLNNDDKADGIGK